MDILDEEILNLWRSFSEHDVKYIVAGGFATNLNGFSRTTADLDIWIEDTPENRKKFRRSLSAVGLEDMPAIETMQFVPGWSEIKLNSGFQLDVMTFMAGMPQSKFEECYKAAPIAYITDIAIRFLHINHLIEAKKASARSKDLIDIEELERIRKAQQ